MSNYLVITSSGGSGHKVASKMIAEQKKEKNPSNRVHEIDVMRSGCSFGSYVGGILTNLWDEAQLEGDIDRQRKLFVLQPLAEKVLFASTFITLFLHLLFSETPKKIVCVQPLHLLAITSAVRAVNFIKFSSKKIDKIDLHFTDLPSEKAEHFMGALHRLRAISQTAFDMIRVKAPDPINEKGEPSDTFWSSHNISKIKKKPLPVGSDFKKPEQLPLPRSEQTIQMLDGQKYAVRAKDKVAFVMLGSNPEKNAILHYVDSYIHAAEKRVVTDKDSAYYLFISCGKGKDSELLKAVRKKIAEAGLNSQIKIVPFESQPISHIFARSDLSITRSGGLTSSEIMALKSRAQDNKRILIHSPMQEYIIGQEETVKQMLLDRIPLWENGNAEQLIWNPSVRAELTNPKLSRDIFSQFFN